MENSFKGEGHCKSRIGIYLPRIRIKVLSLDLTMEKEVEEAAREMMSSVEGERSGSFVLVFVLQHSI